MQTTIDGAVDVHGKFSSVAKRERDAALVWIFLHENGAVVATIGLSFILSFCGWLWCLLTLFA